MEDLHDHMDDHFGPQANEEAGETEAGPASAGEEGEQGEAQQA
jgi:hypothetical protein